ncbi:metallophosphoesterase [Paenibacillus sp. FSL H8-0537]|uniref:metallophosphoesterase n=1 Tax=Paenibacillus sp. FSL H8-0537 TaxID=2921399 RepID=UPI0031015CF4
MVVVMIVAALALLFYLFFILPTQWFKVERYHYPAGLGLKVLQISDLHVENIRISPRRIQKLIAREQPAYIFLTGDFTQRLSYLPKVRQYVKAICAAGIPVYAVFGNHDHRIKPSGVRELTKLLEREGVIVLTNESIDLGAFQLVGIDDWSSKKSKPGKAFLHVDSSKPIIVLAHDPNTVLHIKHAYDYLMSGHFHGMQFNVPFLFRFINKGKLAASGFYKGQHKWSNGTFYISKGISQTEPNARFLIRSEVTVHQL